MNPPIMENPMEKKTEREMETTTLVSKEMETFPLASKERRNGSPKP